MTGRFLIAPLSDAVQFSHGCHLGCCGRSPGRDELRADNKALGEKIDRLVEIFATVKPA